MTTKDQYEAIGEFHDIFMSEPWDALAPALERAFGDLTADDVIVDIGAGTGVGTARLARSTRAQIVAVEPSLTMRAALLARIADDRDLADRVSVLSGSAPDVLDQLEEVSGFICAHMLGHFSEDARQSTFSRLAAILTAHGRGVITLPRERPIPPEGADTQTSIEEERWLGRHRYTASHEIPADDGASAVTVYRVHDGDRVIRSLSAAASWSMPSARQLSAELHDAGLEVTERIGSAVSVRLRAGIPTFEDVRRALPLVPVTAYSTQQPAHAGVPNRPRSVQPPIRRALLSPPSPVPMRCEHRHDGRESAAPGSWTSLADPL